MLNHNAVLNVFQEYMSFGNHTISRAEFEENSLTKKEEKTFNGDIFPLLSPQYVDEYNLEEAYKIVLDNFISRLSGEPWKNKIQKTSNV